MHRIGYSIAAPAARPPGRPCHPYERFCIAFQMRIIYRTRRTCALLEEGSAISVPHAGTPPDGGTGASKRTRSGPDKRITSDMVRCQQMLQEKISNGLINSYDAFRWAHPHWRVTTRSALAAQRYQTGPKPCESFEGSVCVAKEQSNQFEQQRAAKNMALSGWLTTASNACADWPL